MAEFEPATELRHPVRATATVASSSRPPAPVAMAPAAAAAAPRPAVSVAAPSSSVSSAMGDDLLMQRAILLRMHQKEEQKEQMERHDERIRRDMFAVMSNPRLRERDDGVKTGVQPPMLSEDAVRMHGFSNVDGPVPRPVSSSSSSSSSSDSVMQVVRTEIMMPNNVLGMRMGGGDPDPGAAADDEPRQQQQHQQHHHRIHARALRTHHPAAWRAWSVLSSSDAPSLDAWLHRDAEETDTILPKSLAWDGGNEHGIASHLVCPTSAAVSEALRRKTRELRDVIAESDVANKGEPTKKTPVSVLTWAASWVVRGVFGRNNSSSSSSSSSAGNNNNNNESAASATATTDINDARRALLKNLSRASIAFLCKSLACEEDVLSSICERSHAFDDIGGFPAAFDHLNFKDGDGAGLAITDLCLLFRLEEHYGSSSASTLSGSPVKYREEVLCGRWRYDPMFHVAWCLPADRAPRCTLRDMATRFGVRWGGGGTRGLFNDDLDALLFPPPDEEEDEEGGTFSEDCWTFPVPIDGQDLVALKFPLGALVRSGKMRADHMVAMTKRSYNKFGIPLAIWMQLGLNVEMAAMLGLNKGDAVHMKWNPTEYDALRLPAGEVHVRKAPRRPAPAPENHHHQHQPKQQQPQQSSSSPPPPPPKQASQKTFSPVNSNSNNNNNKHASTVTRPMRPARSDGGARFAEMRRQWIEEEKMRRGGK